MAVGRGEQPVRGQADGEAGWTAEQQKKRGARHPTGGEDGQRGGLAVQHAGSGEKQRASGMSGWKQGREEEGESNCGGTGVAGRREGDEGVVVRRALRIAAGRRRRMPTVEVARE